MRLKIASRTSDLARWQAVQVARVFERLPERPSIEFIFKSSLGDQNLDLPLASMGSKGVFTEDFYEDLTSGRCDMVVHSWKDLPVDERSETCIAMTLPRADVRDLLLVPESAWRAAMAAGRLEILTSSPRRVYNLSLLLPRLLPVPLEVVFLPVRGNVPTRLRKMHAENRALVLAKAGLDRLLEAEDDGFIAPDTEIRALTVSCRIMVLPVSGNPPAPAQGALAVEVARENVALLELCRRLTDEQTFKAVESERATLRAYGGGCHQKIGVAVLNREFGVVRALRGETEAGETLGQWRVDDGTSWARALSRENVFPLASADNRWFEREPLVEWALVDRPGLFVARADALPRDFRPGERQWIWAAGLQTWHKLAQRGVWVHGCQDGLGEEEPERISRLAPGMNWTKLTHAAQAAVADVRTAATYRLRDRPTYPDLRGKTHFFWMSRSSFERAAELFPAEIAGGRHACGPGSTWQYLRQRRDLIAPVKVFIGLEQFLEETLP